MPTDGVRKMGKLKQSNALNITIMRYNIVIFRIILYI